MLDGINILYIVNVNNKTGNQRKCTCATNKYTDFAFNMKVTYIVGVSPLFFPF